MMDYARGWMNGWMDGGRWTWVVGVIAVVLLAALIGRASRK